jgi:hypothetical protein
MYNSPETRAGLPSEQGDSHEDDRFVLLVAALTSTLGVLLLVLRHSYNHLSIREKQNAFHRVESHHMLQWLFNAFVHRGTLMGVVGVGISACIWISLFWKGRRRN